MDELVFGRDEALVSIDAWLDGLAGATSRMLLEGEAGIGKSTVLAAGVQAARARGITVLFTRATRIEERLSFAGLTDLLDPVVDGVLADLPTPQREALEAALLRRQALGGPPDSRTIGAATLGCLRTLAARAPVVVVIDDVQWLDPATVSALSFALRRPVVERLGVMLARRAIPGQLPPPLGLHAAEMLTLAIGPLDERAITSVLATTLGWTPTPATLRRVVEVSAGNPLFALELGRALRDRDELRPGEPLPVPERLRDLVLSRLRGLPALQRAVLLTASAVRHPTVSLMRAAAAHPEFVEEAIEAAEDAAFIHRRGDAVAFVHPLFASVLYGSTRASARRAVHARLAQVVTDGEERARHLALAATGPDEETAAELERTSVAARRRGATAAAAELAELALSLTPTDQHEAAWRRQLLAGRHHVDASNPVGARRILGDLVGSRAPAPVRADASIALAGAVYREQGPTAGMALLQEGLALLDDSDEPRLARALAQQAFWSMGGEYHVDTVATLATRAIEIATRHADPTTASWALLMLLFARVIGGQGLDRAALEQTPALDSGARALSFRGLLLTLAGDHSAARDWLDAFRARAVQVGDGASRVLATQQLGELEFRDGDWMRARALLEEAIAEATAVGQLAVAPLAAGYLAVIDTSAGRIAEAREIVERWEAVAAPSGYVPARVYMAWARGFLARCTGDWGGAVAAFEQAWDIAERYGHVEHYTPFRADLVEALIRSGDVVRAGEVLDILENRTSSFPSYAMQCWLRSREQLVAARGDLDQALDAGARAISLIDQTPLPFEAARTRLVHGTVLRRAKRKRDAREALKEAFEGFAALGATLWASEAAAEIERVGLRPTTSTDLTPTEQRVAELAAEGMTNRDIAAALSLSVRTVEANLTRIYGKLGVARRAELVRLLTADRAN